MLTHQITLAIKKGRCVCSKLLHEDEARQLFRQLILALGLFPQMSAVTLTMDPEIYMFCMPLCLTTSCLTAHLQAVWQFQVGYDLEWLLRGKCRGRAFRTKL